MVVARRAGISTGAVSVAIRATLTMRCGTVQGVPLRHGAERAGCEARQCVGGLGLDRDRSDGPVFLDRAQHVAGHLLGPEAAARVELGAELAAPALLGLVH